MSTDSPTGPDIKDIESSLQRLWERARRVSDLVAVLRKENEELRGKLTTEQSAGRELSESLRQKEQELAGVRAELRKLQQNGSSFLKMISRACVQPAEA